MSHEIKVAVVGLDTSHAIEFSKSMQGPDRPAELRSCGCRVVSCLRFPTPFQDEAGLDARQKTLEDLGVRVTTDFDQAVADCDAIMIEINDPAPHLDYFQRCVTLGKPVFLDKPLADNIAHGRRIVELAEQHRCRVFSASSLRFVPALRQACDAVPHPLFATIYGPLGKAPVGSGIIWYGVHAFEMLQRAMGRGAISLRTVTDDAGVTVVVRYPDQRRGIVELNTGHYLYGGCLRDKQKAAPFLVDTSRIYTDLLTQIVAFFHGNPAPLELTDTLEIMAMLDAADRSAKTGEELRVNASSAN